MNNRIIDRDFGIMLMDDEELILNLRPTRGFFTYAIVVSCLTIVGIPLLPVTLLFVSLAYGKFRYWLTNRRVILGSGVIGFRVRSIPLERVSDVALSRTFPELLAGITSVIVRDMTGEALSGAAMLGVSDATTLQRQILDEVHSVNRRESSAENDRSQALPYRSKEQEGEMLALLRRIERNTRDE